MLATPWPDLGLASPVFKEAQSGYLLLPSPAIRDGSWLGIAIPGGGGELIEMFDDLMMNSPGIPGPW